MERKSRLCKNKILTALLVISLLITCIFCALNTGHYAAHKCHDEDCFVCQVIEALVSTQGKIVEIFAVSIFTIAAYLCAAYVYSREEKKDTLVALKVRMDD